MTITQDIHGNTFIGNQLIDDKWKPVGKPWEPNTLLEFIQTALGSNDGANINRASLNSFRIDWKTNTTEETLTGVINKPGSQYISATSSQSSMYTLTANSRMGFSQWNGSNSSTTGVQLLESGLSNVKLFSGSSIAGNYTEEALFWGVGRNDSISYFVKEGETSFFLSQGILQDSLFTFPDNRYSIALRSIPGDSRISAISQGTAVVDLSTSGEVANYPHIKARDKLPTTSEVELYLKSSSDGKALGWVPNLFKQRIDPQEIAPNIGDIFSLNFNNATGFYAQQEEALCIVVGRLGSTSETDLTGDYLLMRCSSSQMAATQSSQ